MFLWKVIIQCLGSKSYSLFNPSSLTRLSLKDDVPPLFLSRKADVDEEPSIVGMKKQEHAVLLCTKNHVLIMSRLSQMKLIDVLQTAPFFRPLLSIDFSNTKYQSIHFKF